MTAPARPRRHRRELGFAGPAPGAKEPAGELPVARVLVDVSLAHLDRPYDYLVPEPDSVAAQPGVRVRVRFAGRLVSGFVLERLAESEHQGRLGFLERVLSAEPVLTAEVAELARVVAERYAGSTADVLRLAVPPRHAKTEAEITVDPAQTRRGDAAATDGADAVHTRPEVPHPDGSPAAGAEPIDAAGEVFAESAAGLAGRTGCAGWGHYPSGVAFLSAVRERRPARAVWQALPGEDWPARLAEAAKTAADAGFGALLIVPDARDLARLDAALSSTLDGTRHVTLAADLGPAERYRRFLAVSRGQVVVVAGTRAATFAPVRNLGLVAVFDDGDDLLAEPRAPYPHAREVLMLRSAAGSCALLVGGFARTAEAQLLVESGWAQPIVAQRATVRAAAPRMAAAGDEYSVGADSAAAQARLSPAAFAAARAALKAGAPVLVQVPRSGYVPTLACIRCRRRAQCRHCRGPLAQPGATSVTGPGGYSAAGGAASQRPISIAPHVVPIGCGRSRWVRAGPRRRSAGRFPGFR